MAVRRSWLACMIVGLAMTAVSCKKPVGGVDDGGLADGAADGGVDGAASLSDAGPAPSAPLPANPSTAPASLPLPLTFRSGETWTGAFVCKDGQSSLELRIAKGAPLVSGILRFTNLKTHVSGSFKISGTFESRTRHLRLKPGDWLTHPQGGATLTLDGKLTPDGNTFAGTVTGPGCRTFGVSRLR